MMQVTLDARNKLELENPESNDNNDDNRSNFDIPRFQKFDLLPAGIGVCGGQQKSDQISMHSVKNLNEKIVFSKGSLKKDDTETDENMPEKEEDKEDILIPAFDHSEDVFVKYCKIEDYNDRGFWECFQWNDWRNPPNLVEVYQEYMRDLEDENKWSAF